MVIVNFGSVRKRTCNRFDKDILLTVNMHTGFRNTQLPNESGKKFFNGFLAIH